MKKLIFLLMPFFTLILFTTTSNAQDESSASGLCDGYPQDEMCCQKNKGTWAPGESGNFCYVNLLASRATKLDCMNAGGYAYWRNDSTMLCIPKGILVMTGDVSAVDENAKTVTLISEGNTFTIHSPEMELPKSGVVIDMYYTLDPDGKMYGRTCHPVIRLMGEREDN